MRQTALALLAVALAACAGDGAEVRRDAQCEGPCQEFARLLGVDPAGAGGVHCPDACGDGTSVCLCLAEGDAGTCLDLDPRICAAD